MKPSPFSTSVLAGLLAALLLAPPASGQEKILPTGAESVDDPLPSERGNLRSEGAEFLLLPIGARAVGMGGAVTGMRGVGELVLWNPAGVASLEGRRLLFNHSEGAFDTRSEVLALLWPSPSLGTFAVTYYLVDWGELLSTNTQGTVQGKINFRNQEFLLSYARRLIGSLEAGVNYKLIQMVFRCEGTCVDQQSFTRTTHALDLGVVYDELVGLPLSVGGAVRHLGFALKGAEQKDPLPTRVRVGMAYKATPSFSNDSTLALRLAVDLEDQWRELGQPDVMVGSELGVAERFFVRAGYAFLDSGFGGPSLGVGLIYDWFYLDLSRGFDEMTAASGEEAVQVSFGVIF